MPLHDIHPGAARLTLAVALAIAAGCGSNGVSLAGGTGTGGHSASSTSTSTSAHATSGGPGTSTSSATTTGAGGAGTGTSTTTTAGTTGTGTTSSGTTTGAGTGGGSGVADPGVDGPYTFTEIDDTTMVAATGDVVPIHCAYPTSGPKAGPYPVIVVAHGFQLPASQYYGYVKRLASFGYVALTADFPAGLFGANNVNNAKDVLGGLDWAAGKAVLSGKADTNNAGATGHSLGGKVALLAATMDARIKASITLDPVNSAMGCTPQNCPDVAAKMPSLKIPTGFLGETTDAIGAFMACAPAAANYTTFYAGTNAPSLEVTVLGANHMSFLDDVSTCGFTCSFCNPAKAPNAQVNGMARAYVVAFYERYLRGDVAYDTYLTGAEAKALYGVTGQATIQSK